ncbi:metallophosphoesterase [Bacillus sp. 3255]|uniref:metallophosphoesterase family protein n=1 Tax=Bacillus sp. 3255 TaxID=2817904 RepID=UPI002855AA21|nr:metallophosphoesterase [Bacillus sp. 3255]MDR6885039.1 putative MPP superfamily phosphohydrolase [Bacillus sp. 3255]
MFSSKLRLALVTLLLVSAPVTAYSAGIEANERIVPGTRLSAALGAASSDVSGVPNSRTVGLGAVSGAGTAGSALGDPPALAPLFSFSVLSDIHITAGDQVSELLLTRALADHHKVRPDSKLLVLNGDLTGGSEADYRSLLWLLSRQPHAPVHATMGNHDYYGVWRTPNGGMDTSRMNPSWSSQKAVALFDRMWGYDKPYHELIVEGYRFLFLSGEAYRDVNAAYKEDAFLSPEQLAWLRERLAAADAADGGKPVFVFLHQPLPQTLDGTDRELGVVQHQELRALLDAHPNVIMFSGHTHWNLETTNQVKQLKFLAASSASIREVWNAQNEPETIGVSQSLVVDVYKDRVVIHRREHTTKRWIEPSIAKGYDVK